MTDDGSAARQDRRIDEAYLAHFNVVHRRASRILRDEAAALDVAQEAFMRWLKRRLSGEETERDTAAFLFKTVTNLAINHLRDRKRQSELLKRWHEGRNAEPQSHQGAERIDIRLVLAGVDPTQAEVALHHYVDGMSLEEIAELYGTSKRSITRRLESFRQSAQKILETGR
ncbi:MAG: sigma-70 family RNA polymerase sigma factor [Myxococcales bacterium]|nr:sigma-70 family RNA polymerase sigma factor [Myxococcales bacterium]